MDATQHLFCPALLAFVALACTPPSENPADEAAPPLTSDVISQDLPADHPPIPDSAARPDMRIVEPPAGSGSGTTGLEWRAPEDWEQQQPRSAMRKAQYRVAGPGGDAECVVFYFGPGQGGDAMANALRWADQFSQPDGSSSRDALVTEEISVGEMTILLSEVTGTYSGGMSMMGGPAENLEGYMLLGAVAEGPDANWFFKLTGPEATVAANKNAFRAMVESLKTGA